MARFEVDYEYDTPNFGVTEVVAKDADQAFEVALDQLSSTLDPEVMEIEVTAVREIKEKEKSN